MRGLRKKEKHITFVVDSPNSGVTFTIEKLSTSKFLQLGGASKSYNQLGFHMKISFTFLFMLCFELQWHDDYMMLMDVHIFQFMYAQMYDCLEIFIAFM